MNPIRCRVSGGYTISKRQGYRATESPESLLTCILQVGLINLVHRCFIIGMHNHSADFCSHFICCMLHVMSAAPELMK